jgi:hypothetical protein
MPFRRLFRPFAFGAMLLLALASARTPVPLVPEIGTEECSEEGTCQRCPAPARRAPEACRVCPQSSEAVAARRVRLALPSPRTPELFRGDRRVPSVALADRAATLRHEVLGASPPKTILLATLRN